MTASVARADLAENLSDVVFEITATNAQGTATLSVTQAMGTFIGDDIFMWNIGAAMDLIDPDTMNTIATVGGANVFYQGDPTIAMGFSVTAGLSDTSFTISSGLLGFDELSNPDGLVSVGLTLTDGNGDGGALMGHGDDMTLGSWQYNGQAPGGTEFVPLVGQATVDPGGSFDFAGDTGGFVSVGEAVSDMSAIFTFDLSAGDQASSTSNYVMQQLPAPAGLAVLAGLGIVGRRRRRG
jgi:MYXO-CTERM domain-containing protein